ncbi:MAG: hypothetical protein U0230_20795 [Polyangiales bacterium]
MIDDEDKARRLARALASDIRLYHEEELRTGTDLSGPMTEARELFESRVVPALHPLFDVELAGMGITRIPPPARTAPVASTAAPAASAAAPAQAPPRPRPTLDTAPAPSTGLGVGALLAIAIILAAVAGGMVTYLVLRG